MIELAKLPAEAPKYGWLEVVFAGGTGWCWEMIQVGMYANVPGYMDWNGVKGSEPDPDVSVG